MRLTVSCDGITLERESSQCPERARNRATDEEVVAEKLKRPGTRPLSLPILSLIWSRDSLSR